MKLEYIPQIDAKMYLRDHTDLWGWYQNNEYEPAETELVKKLVKSNDVCLDIGANIGYYTILMAKQCKVVYAFEPEPTNFDLLKKNTDFLDNVSLHQKAVDHDNGSVPLYLCDTSHGMHRVYKSKFCNNGILVECISLDKIWSNTRKIDFVKMDIEGSEIAALQGMVRLLVRDKPTMLIEFHPPSIIEFGADPQQLYYLLKSLGYEIYLVPDIDNPISYEDLYKQTNDESGGRNILCIQS